MAIVAAIATVGATAASVRQQKKASRAQQRQQELQTRRSQRQSVREAQIRRAQAQAQAQALGAGGGSAVAGGLSSISSQLGGGLGFAGQMSGLSKQISVASQKAQTAGAIAGLSGQAFSSLGGFGTIFPGEGPADPTDLLSGLSPQ